MAEKTKLEEVEETPLRIIYEDNHLIVINKRSGDIVQADKTNDEPLPEKIKEYIREKYHKNGNIYCGVIHRIDRPVSGVVIFAKTSKALARMNQLVHDRQVKKIYWAIVKQLPPEPEGHLTHYLFRDEKRNKTLVSATPKDGYLKAELNYRHIASSDIYHLLEVELITGRHHQIRSQLSAIGCPIRGDLKYGFPRSCADASIGLHARSLTFIHPVSLQTIEIVADPPKDKLWNQFCNILNITRNEQ